MKRANWTIAHMCLTGGLLCGALVSPTVAEDAATGVVRITKARTTPPVQQTNFSAQPAEGAAAPQLPIQTGVGPTEAPEQNVSPSGNAPNVYGGAPVWNCYEDYEEYQDNWRTHDWSCDCRSCRFHRRTRDHSLACEAGFDRIRDGARGRARDRAGRCRDGFGRICSHDPFCSCFNGCFCDNMCMYLHCKFGYFCPSGKGMPFHGCYSRVYPQDVNYFDQRDGQMFSAQGYGVPIAVPLAPVVGQTYNYGWGVPASRLTPISTLAPRY